MSLLIEAARSNLQRMAQMQEAARTREEELSQIRGMYADMFSDCMSLLRAAPDPAPQYPRWVLPYWLMETLMIKHWGAERRITRKWQDGAGEPINVTLDGWPLHRADPYAKLVIAGLGQTCRMDRDSDTGQIRGYIIDENLLAPKYRAEAEVSVQEVEKWKQIVDFLKAS